MESRLASNRFGVFQFGYSAVVEVGQNGVVRGPELRTGRIVCTKVCCNSLAIGSDTHLTLVKKMIIGI